MADAPDPGLTGAGTPAAAVAPPSPPRPPAAAARPPTPPKAATTPQSVPPPPTAAHSSPTPPKPTPTPPPPRPHRRPPGRQRPPRPPPRPVLPSPTGPPRWQANRRPGRDPGPTPPTASSGWPGWWSRPARRGDGRDGTIVLHRRHPGPRHWVPYEVWLPYFILGAIFLAGGLFLWSKRSAPRPAADSTGRNSASDRARCRHHRVRSRRTHRGHLRGPREPPAPGVRGRLLHRRPARRPAHAHHRRGELPRLRRGHPGARADGHFRAQAARFGAEFVTDKVTGWTSRAAPFGSGWATHLPGPVGDRVHRRQGQEARPGRRAPAARPRRVDVRHLRRLLLPGQDDRRRRRRRLGPRGGQLPHQVRQRRSTWSTAGTRCGRRRSCRTGRIRNDKIEFVWDSVVVDVEGDTGSRGPSRT